MDRALKGKILTLSGAIAWGLSGACGQYLMHDSGVSPVYLTAIRMLIAGFCLSVVAIYKQPQDFRLMIRDQSVMIQLFVFSVFGLLACQLTYLFAINASNAGTATVLEYTCPVLIVMYVSFRQRTMPTKIEIVAIVLALLGTFIIATHGQVTSLALTPDGLIWGIISAFTYALYTLIPGKLIHRWGTLLVCGVGLFIGGVFMFLVSAAWRYTFEWKTYTLWAFIGIVFVGTVLAYSLFLEGVSIIGPVEGSLLASAEPISSVFFSVILLGETFQWIDFVGIVGILAAVYLITIKDKLKENRMKVNRVS